MVLGSRSEERIKQLLDEYITRRNAELDAKVTDMTIGIFVWGFMAGVITAYSGMWPFLFGSVVGYYLAKKDWGYLDNIYLRLNNVISSGYQKLDHYLTIEQSTELEVHN